MSLAFAFAAHVHQPLGNFDHVFREHVDEVYLPFLERVAARGLLPITLHVSGPLLDWLEAHGGRYLDLVGRLVADGDAELLLSGRWEPILAALPRRERREQVEAFRDLLARRFGVPATGLWLTERVWEPGLAADLAAAGVAYALVDDRHLLVDGLSREELDRPLLTEADGRSLRLLSIDERLRYLVPFRPPAETSAFLRARHGDGAPLAVLGDDGEKFGGWPDTREWVYAGGWLDGFIDAVEELRDEGVLRLVTTGEAAALPARGLAYPPGGSYREMEEWALPGPQARRLEALRAELGEERLRGPDGSFVRGGHWKHFLVKYPEANRMHKTMLALSGLCRERGDPPEARRAVARAACNDAYWHGVFGGIYLPHLRRAVWRELGAAERLLRRGEGLVAETIDLDMDGHDEIWIHSDRLSVLVAPRRGGGIERLADLRGGRELADTLTRRREAYHAEAGVEARVGTGGAPGCGSAPGRSAGRRAERAGGDQEALPRPDAGSGGSGSRPGAVESIHERERSAHRPLPPGLDHDPRALFLERVLPGACTRSEHRRGAYEPLASWAGTPFEPRLSTGDGVVRVELSAAGLEKEIRVGADGGLEVRLEWETGGWPDGARFATEISLAVPVEPRTDPEAERWRDPIVTLARSERGFERIEQGTSLTLRWPAELGRARVVVPPRPDAPGPDGGSAGS